MTWRGAVELPLVRKYLALTRGGAVVGGGLRLGGASLRRAAQFRGPGHWHIFVGRWTVPWQDLERFNSLDGNVTVKSSGGTLPYNDQDAEIFFELTSYFEMDESSWGIKPGLEMPGFVGSFSSVGQVIDPLPENGAGDLRDDELGQGLGLEGVRGARGMNTEANE